MKNVSNMIVFVTYMLYLYSKILFLSYYRINFNLKKFKYTIVIRKIIDWQVVQICDLFLI